MGLFRGGNRWIKMEEGEMVVLMVNVERKNG